MQLFNSLKKLNIVINMKLCAYYAYKFNAGAETNTYSPH